MSAPLNINNVQGWLLSFAQLLIENKEVLTQLDSAIGDADHGINMERGANAIINTLEEQSFDSVKTLLESIADALLEGIGGAAGPLYASLLYGAADSTPQEPEIGMHQLAEALQAGVTSLSARGRAELGDKTMFDAAFPAAAALVDAVNSSDDPAAILSAGAEAAAEGRDATIPMQAKKGRASYLGPRSVGHLDPGAASVALMFEALSTLLDVSVEKELSS